MCLRHHSSIDCLRATLGTSAMGGAMYRPVTGHLRFPALSHLPMSLLS